MTQSYRLIKAIALAKGAINRLETEQRLKWVEEIFKTLWSKEAIDYLENWLANLSDERLEIVVDGEESEREAIIPDEILAPVNLRNMLDDLYDAIL